MTDPTKPCCQHTRDRHATGDATHCMAEHCDCQAWTDPTKPGREQLEAVTSQVLDALESDATLEQRREAFDALRDLVFPVLPIVPEPGREDEAAALAREIVDGLPYAAGMQIQPEVKATWYVAAARILARFLRERERDYIEATAVILEKVRVGLERRAEQAEAALATAIVERDRWAGIAGTSAGDAEVALAESVSAPPKDCKPWLHFVVEGAATCRCGRVGVESSGFVVLDPPAPAPEAPPEWARIAAVDIQATCNLQPSDIPLISQDITVAYLASEEARKVARLEAALRAIRDASGGHTNAMAIAALALARPEQEPSRESKP